MADANLFEMLKQKLLGAQAPPQPAPMPMQGKPWEQPLMGQPQGMPAGQPSMPMPAPQEAVGAMPGTPLSPMDEALMLALKRKQFNQAFAGGTGNPIPQ